MNTTGKWVAIIVAEVLVFGGYLVERTHNLDDDDDDDDVALVKLGQMLALVLTPLMSR